MRKNKKLWIAVFALSLLFTEFIACRKSDPEVFEQETIFDHYTQLKKQFFNSANADPEVIKVSADFKKQDSIYKFLPDFVKKNGIPKWDKVLYQTQKGKEVVAYSNGRKASAARIDTANESESQGIFLIPLQSTTSSDIKSYITAYKHNDSLYTYRLYNKDSLNTMHPDSFQARKNLLNAVAVFGYFEKSINGKDSIIISAPSNGTLKNIQIGFDNNQNGRLNNNAKEAEITCEMTMTLTIEYEWRDFSYPAGDGVWVAVSINLEIEITCTGEGGGGGCQCSSLDPPGAGSYWWLFGTGWPWYNTAGWQGYYFDPNDPWYPWWTSGGGSGVNPFPPAELTQVDVSQINDPCLEAVIAAIGAPGHLSLILRTYDQSQYTPSTLHRYIVTYKTDNTLTGSNGQPIPGHSIVNVLPDGTNEVVITLNTSLFQNTSKEWVTAVILHELVHGIITVNQPVLNDQVLQHISMFHNKAPLTIWQSLHELFPNLAEHDGIALGMDGLSDAYLMDDPNNPGTQIIDPYEDQFAQTNYFQNINQAVATAGAYMNGTSGTPFC